MLTIEQETVLCRRFYVSGCKCIIVLQLYPTTTLQAEFAIYVSDSEDGKRKFLTVALENEETFVKKEALSFNVGSPLLWFFFIRSYYIKAPVS